jgi:predicted small metal-binding protein
MSLTGGAGMEKEIACDCGWRARGTDEELIAAAQEHGRHAHDMVPTPEQVLATAKPVMTQE